MKPALLLSKKLIAEYGDRVQSIIDAAPSKIDILGFDESLELSSAEADAIEVAYYSRDVWEGTVRGNLTPAARAFWNILDRARNIKWLAVYSAGTDAKQYQPLMARGVRLTTSAGAQSEPVALAAVAGLLALARKLPHWMAAQARREWSPLRGAEVPPDLPGQTAVIVGVGHIGTIIARVLKAMGLRTVGVRRRVLEAESFDEVHPLAALDALLPTCDWLILACPLTAQTANLIDARRLSLMRPSAGLVNIARGEVTDETALARALSTGRLACAYLDVFATEPLPADSTFWGLPNVLISPHNAGASRGTAARGVEIFLRNLANYLHGRALENDARAE